MQLKFPTYNFKVKNTENGNYIFDIIRKKDVLLTPEEWVRQHLVHYLINNCKCPASLIAVEKGLMYNGLKKRFDVLVFDNTGKPIMLCECKSPEVDLTDETFLQASVYNKRLGVRHLLITNGLELNLCSYNHDFSSHIIRFDVPQYPFI